MNEKVKELIDKLLSLLEEYHTLFSIDAIIQILETVKNIEKSSAIKTIKERNKDLEYINPKEIKSF